MTKSYPDILALSRTVLRLVIKLNLLMGVLILALLLASLIWETFVMRALGVRPADSYPTLLIGLRLLMVIGICGVPVVHFVLTRLLAIVESVSRGNPFVRTNAAGSWMERSTWLSAARCMMISGLMTIKRYFPAFISYFGQNCFNKSLFGQMQITHLKALLIIGCPTNSYAINACRLEYSDILHGHLMQ